MYRVVVFLAMAMGSLRDLEACTHRHICFHSREQFLMEEWPKLDFAFMPHPRAVSISQSPMNCNASADGPLNSRSISPWIYELDRDPNRFPQDLYHARCQCPHCVSLQTGSDMEPRGNSEEVFYNQTVFYRRPCRGRHGGPDSYCLEPRLYPVSLACVCVRPRVSG